MPWQAKAVGGQSVNRVFRGKVRRYCTSGVVQIIVRVRSYRLPVLYFISSALSSRKRGAGAPHLDTCSKLFYVGYFLIGCVDEFSKNREQVSPCPADPCLGDKLKIQFQAGRVWCEKRWHVYTAFDFLCAVLEGLRHENLSQTT